MQRMVGVYRWLVHVSLERDSVTAWLLFIGALGLRCYRLSAHPLWLDEIYGVQLGQLGAGAILANSRLDPHPPFFYFVQWISTGFGRVYTEWTWRWLSAFCGAAAIPLVYGLVRRQGVGWPSALLGSTLLAVNPMLLYFSQESRSPALEMLLAALLTVALWRIHDHPDDRRVWVSYTLVALLGLYTSYSFAIVVGLQLMYTFAVPRLRWRALACGGALLLAMAPLLALTLGPVLKLSTHFATGGLVTFWQLAASLLGGDIVRYGWMWSNTLLIVVAGLLSFAGVWWGWRNARRTTSYYVAQVVVPLVCFFGAATALPLSLPASQAKQFITLLPALTVLVAQGFEHAIGGAPPWARVVTRSMCALLFVGALAASAVNLQRYWTTTKSPEGRSVLFVREQIQPGDAVVSAHYSTDAALSFYLPDAPYFNSPRRVEDQYLFAQDLRIVTGTPKKQPTIATQAIVGRYQRIWLLALQSREAALLQAFNQYCAPKDVQTFGPFHVTLLTECRAQ